MNSLHMEDDADNNQLTQGGYKVSTHLIISFRALLFLSENSFLVTSACATYATSTIYMFKLKISPTFPPQNVLKTKQLATLFHSAMVTVRFK